MLSAILTITILGLLFGLLLGGLAQKTVLDTLREEGEDVELDDVIKDGYGGSRWPWRWQACFPCPFRTCSRRALN